MEVWARFTEWFIAAFFFILIACAAALGLAVALLVSTYRKVRQIDLPEDAGFFATLRELPLLFVVGLDLLDFSLDFFAAPIGWVILDRLGLKGLRDKAALEMLIPFTQPIPTMTAGWVLARILKGEVGPLESRPDHTDKTPARIAGKVDGGP